MDPKDLVSLDLQEGFWESVLLPAPLTLVGTTEADGSCDLAPKHMVMPLGWGPWLGVVCAPTHATYRNAERTRTFTVSWLRPQQVLAASLGAGPRDEAGKKPSLQAIGTFAARQIEGRLVSGAALFAECELDRVVDGLGPNVLLIGRMVACHASPAVLRHRERDDGDLLAEEPLLVYVHPNRFGELARTTALPLHVGFHR